MITTIYGTNDIVEDVNIKQLKDNSNLTEEMKNTDMIYWGRTMNTIKNQAEEIIYNNLVFN